jgi:signal transduction histidine kinase
MNSHPALGLLLSIGLIQFWLMPLIAWVLLRDQRDRAAQLWFAGTACYAGTASLFVFQLLLPAGVILMIGLALVALMLMLMIESLRIDLRGGPTPWRWVVGVPVVNVFVLVAVEHEFGLEVMRATQLALISVIDGVCVALIFAARRRHRSRALVFVMVGFIIVLITNLLRIHGYLTRGDSLNLLAFSTFSNLGFIANFLSVVLYSFGYWGFVIEKSRTALIRETDQRARAQAEEANARAREAYSLELLNEREELIQQLSLMQRAAQAGALSATIAHEINQPLASVRLSVEQAIEFSKAGDHRDEIGSLLQRIASENRRAATIISTLRDIFRGRKSLPENRSLDEVVSSMCSLMDRRARDAGIRIESRPGAPIQVAIGAGELEHVILNLLSNAIDALTKTPSDDARIRVTTSIEGDWAELWVSDNGAGISPQLRSRLFNIFVGSSDSGLGLGLWLSRHIVERNGGTIDLSEPEQSTDPNGLPGASFRVRLALSGQTGPT